MNKQRALAVAAKFGYVLDDVNSGTSYCSATVIFDHPTHSHGGDCTSIVATDGSMRDAWQYAIERMNEQGPTLTPCDDPDCDYHAN